MGGRGSKYRTAREIAGQYSLSALTDSKNRIVDFYRDIDRNGGIRIDEEAGKIKVTRDAMERARDLANALSRRMVERDESTISEYREMREMLSGEYTLSDQDRSNIPDFGAYARSRENFLKIRRQGTSIDTVYEELADRYPYYFDADRVVNPADRLLDINRVLSDLRDRRTRAIPRDYQEEAANELRSDIIRGYIGTLSERRRGRRSA